MASESGTVLLIEKIDLGKNKPPRIDLIILPIGKHKPSRIQVRKKHFDLLNGIEVKDEVEVEFYSEFNEVERYNTAEQKMKTQRFDNNILESIKKT